MKSVIYFDNDAVEIKGSEIISVGTQLEPGIYNARSSYHGELSLKTHEFKELLDPILSEEAKMVIGTIEKFLCPQNKALMNKYGFLHKLGILLFGKQGTGKTSLFKHLISKATKENQAVCFTINNEDNLKTTRKLMKEIRKVQDNPIILLFDELDYFLPQSESDLKNLFDGTESEDNFMILAATNHLNKIPKSLSDRPSRFKLVVEYRGIQEADKMLLIAKRILKDLDKDTEERLRQIFSQMKSVTVDEIKHIVQDLIMGTKFTINRNHIGFNNFIPFDVDPEACIDDAKHLNKNTNKDVPF